MALRSRSRARSRLHLAPLTDQQSRALLGERYGSRLAVDAAEPVLRSAAGNPLALIELGAGSTPNGSARPTVEARYATQIRAFGPPTQTLLLLAAADDAGEIDIVARAARTLALPLEGFELAEAAGLVAIIDGRIRFRHPLVRSAAYKSATLAHRRRAHLALASVLDPATALERAAQLSPEAGDRARRLVDAAEAARLAGQRERALALLGAADISGDEVGLRVKAARVARGRRGAERRARRRDAHLPRGRGRDLSTRSP